MSHVNKSQLSHLSLNKEYWLVKDSNTKFIDSSDGSSDTKAPEKGIIDIGDMHCQASSQQAILNKPH